MKSRTSSVTSSSRRRERAPGILPGENAIPFEAPDYDVLTRQDAGGTLNRIPGATYRLQFNADFTLEQAREVVDYLHGLGVTDFYASPLFQAGPNSTHGYDTCSHSQIGESLGGEEAFKKLATALRERGMGLLLDVVPNHMGACASNAWWWDVLKHGRESQYARYFDIDWERGGDKLVLPVLGSHLPEVIRAGELKLVDDGGELLIAYYDNRFPIAPRSRSSRGNETFTEHDWLKLLDAQHYRLASWRVGPSEINYRRFFDVTGLVAMRMEDEEVFAATHEKLFEMVERGAVTGLRIDHPDGLRDPREYFERLHRVAADSLANSHQLFIVGEKILSGSEPLPTDWPIAGTSGYDFLVKLNSLFVARENERSMTDIYREFTGNSESFDDIAYRSKKRVLNLSFIGDVDALAGRLDSFARCEFTRTELREAIVEFIACFDVYRTYVTEKTDGLSPQDRDVLARALSTAKQRAPQLTKAIEFLHSVLSLKAELPPSQPRNAREFVLRFQQLSGPAAAKGIEDTAFYNFHRLVSLNEVGGDPGEFGTGVEAFHEGSHLRAKHWPHSLLATATHDTKRGEDTRARINVLSEIPNEWRAAALRWRDMNGRLKTNASSMEMPDANDEYLLYQTLVGTWTASGSTEEYRDRIAEYMLKAIKEAKQRTSWTEPNDHYEKATVDFVQRVLAPANAEFLGDFVEFQRKISFFGVFNSLSQTLLKLTSPGVPDIYQGCELWDLSLVDPDNRRPVDFALRRELLEHVRDEESLRESWPESHGALKLFLIERVLKFRNAHRELFDAGDYLPLETGSDHLCAFARKHGEKTCITIATRLICTLVRGREMPPIGRKVWPSERINTDHIAATKWRNVITGEEFMADGAISIAEALKSFPVALLASA